MKHFNMTQWRVLCPHNHILKTTSTTGDISELSSYRSHEVVPYWLTGRMSLCVCVCLSEQRAAVPLIDWPQDALLLLHLLLIISEFHDRTSTDVAGRVAWLCSTDFSYTSSIPPAITSRLRVSRTAWLSPRH